MSNIRSVADVRDWNNYRSYLKERIKALEDGEHAFLVSKEKFVFENAGKEVQGRAFLVGDKAAAVAQALKKEGLVFRSYTCRKTAKELVTIGLQATVAKQVEFTVKKLALGVTTSNEGEVPDGEAPGVGATEAAAAPGAAPGGAISDAFEAAKKLVTDTVTKLGESLSAADRSEIAAALTTLQQQVKNGEIVAAGKSIVALKALLTRIVKEIKSRASFEKRGIDKAKAAEMAKFSVELEDAGYEPKRAAMCAEVSVVLKDQGVPADRAVEIARMSDPKGTSTVADAVASAKAMAIFPKSMLETMRKNGATVVSCRGPVTDAIPDLKGVQPRGWPDGMTWDNVPGLYSPSDKTIVLGTMATGTDGKDRKVPGPGEGPIQHGAFDLAGHEAGHEAGHGFDFSGGSPHKSRGAKFRSARKKDIRALAKKKTDLGAYFMQAGAAGPEETFAESCARFFGGDATLAAEWKNLHAFWNSNPY